ncbi:MAG: flagellar biosynthesis protein FlhB, partial [Clostridiales bacterium]|nr:flagellar biosynthesis protein FlhB [Clostridiales bacterium]
MAGEEKTERATPKKREKAREEGNVLQSKEIVTAFFLLIVFYSLKVL